MKESKLIFQLQTGQLEPLGLHLKESSVSLIKLHPPPTLARDLIVFIFKKVRASRDNKTKMLFIR